MQADARRGLRLLHNASASADILTHGSTSLDEQWADAADRPWNAFAREHALGDGRALRVLATTPPVERMPLELDRQEVSPTTKSDG